MNRKKHKVTMFDNDYLIATDPLEVWCERYNLTVKTQKCLYCENEISTTIPAFGKGWRGLVAPDCSCGKKTNFRHYVLSKDGEFDGLMKVIMP